MEREVYRVIASCSCVQSKVPRTLPTGKLKPLPIPERPWSHVSIDLVTDLPKSHGNTTLLVMVDIFSKSVRFVPLHALPTTLMTAEALFQHVFRYFGIPEEIVSDRSPQFTSRVCSSFMEKMGILVSLTSGYHPQVNGQVKRVNQELGWFLRTFCASNSEDWSRFLPWAEYTQNSLLHSATGLTPFQCVLGYQPLLFPWNATPTESPAVDQWFQRSEQVWANTHQRLRQTAQAYKRKADRRHSEHPNYQPSDRVWLSTTDLRQPHGCKKLTSRYTGPFKILKQVNEVTYHLDLP